MTNTLENKKQERQYEKFDIKFTSYGEVIEKLFSKENKESSDMLVAIRKGWNNLNQHIAVYVPEGEMKKMKFIPFTYIQAVNKTKIPWVASQTDALSHDWVICRQSELPRATESLKRIVSSEKRKRREKAELRRKNNNTRKTDN